MRGNLAGLFSYILGWVTGLAVIVVEREDSYVRFHALQSIAAFGALTVLIPVLLVLHSRLPFFEDLFGILSIMAIILGAILWIVLMYKAYRGERYKLPVAGDWADKYA
jgi:uncharacterized membrane protein